MKNRLKTALKRVLNGLMRETLIAKLTNRGNALQAGLLLGWVLMLLLGIFGVAVGVDGEFFPRAHAFEGFLK